MSSIAKTSVALAVGAANIALNMSAGQSVPSVTYTGGAIYWMSYALGIPAIVAGLTWLARRNSPDRSKRVANAFLIATLVFLGLTGINMLTSAVSN